MLKRVYESNKCNEYFGGDIILMKEKIIGVIVLVCLIVAAIFIFKSVGTQKDNTLTPEPTVSEKERSKNVNASGVLSSRINSYFGENGGYPDWYGGNYVKEDDGRLMVMIKSDFYSEDKEKTEWYEIIESLKKPEQEVAYESCNNSYAALEKAYELLINNEEIMKMCSGGFSFEEGRNIILCGCTNEEKDALTEKISGITDIGLIEFNIDADYGSKNL